MLRCSDFPNVSALFELIYIIVTFRLINICSLHMLYIKKLNFSIRPQLIDAATAAQTPACQEALMEYLKFEHPENIELPERYILSVALSSTHPTEQLLSDLLVSKIFSSLLTNTRMCIFSFEKPHMYSSRPHVMLSKIPMLSHHTYLQCKTWTIRYMLR